MAARREYGLEELRRDLKKNGVAPVYVIEGEEPLLASDAAQAIVAAVLPEPSGRDFNLSVFSGDDETGRQFLAQARSYPFLADRRVVLVRRFDKLALRDREEQAFLEYLAAPAPTTVLILVAVKLDRRTTLVKTLERAARLVDASTLDDRALPGWVRQRFEAAGVPATDGACKRLVELAGPGLLDLANEIEKLRARFHDLPRIDVAQVEAIVDQHRAEEVWALHRAFRPDDPGGFLRALGRVLETEPEDGIIRITALLARHVNDLLRVRSLLDRGSVQSGAIAARLRKSPWQVDQMLPQARAWNRDQLRLWVRNLQVADMQMKSVALPDRWVFERALLNSFLGQEMA